MYECNDTAAHQAVNRLFELVRDGETGNGEFQQLESMIYDSLLQTYAVDEVVTSGLVTQTAD